MDTKTAETNGTTKNQTVVLWALNDGTPLSIALGLLVEKAARFGKGDHSIQYWAEDMLSRGCETFNNYLDADKARRDAMQCEKEINALAALDLPDAEYGMRVKSIRRKFGIGAEKKTL